MPSPDEPSLTVEAAHILFMDIVGFTRYSLAGQVQTLHEFQRALRQSPAFQRAAEAHALLCLPTGDGAALAFFHNPIAPLRCAMEVGRSLRRSSFALRMGLHSGMVCRVPDINGHQNVSGEGVNLAQRVMDCGDAGHILVSETVAALLLQLEGWEQRVHDWGEVVVKHGQRIHVYNLLLDGLGNPVRPQRLQSLTTTSLPWMEWEEVPVAPAPAPRAHRGYWVTPEKLTPETLVRDVLPFAPMGLDYFPASDLFTTLETAGEVGVALLDCLFDLEE